PQRLVLFASIVSLLRLLHSYVILSTRRSLRLVLSAPPDADKMTKFALKIKLGIVFILCLSIFIISEPYLFHRALWFLFPGMPFDQLSGDVKSEVIIAFTV